MRKAQPLAAACSDHIIHRKLPAEITAENYAPRSPIRRSRSAPLVSGQIVRNSPAGENAPRSAALDPLATIRNSQPLDNNQWPVIRGSRLAVRLAGSALDGSRLDLLPAKKSPHDGGLDGCGDWLAGHGVKKALRRDVEMHRLEFADIDHVALKY